MGIGLHWSHTPSPSLSCSLSGAWGGQPPPLPSFKSTACPASHAPLWCGTAVPLIFWLLLLPPPRLRSRPAVGLLVGVILLFSYIQLSAGMPIINQVGGDIKCLNTVFSFMPGVLVVVGKPGTFPRSCSGVRACIVWFLSPGLKVTPCNQNPGA